MLVRAGKTTASVMFVIACSGVFAWMLTREQVPTRIAEGLLGGVGDGVLLLLLMIALFVVLGLFMESLAAMALTSGVVMAVGTAAGIEPLHLSLIAVLALSLGVITPPVGVVLFVTSKIAKTSIERTSVSVLPYVLVYIIGMILLALLPDVALFLPRLLLD
jgi:C4-dicarboxylate transporter DctM subunit